MNALFSKTSLFYEHSPYLLCPRYLLSRCLSHSNYATSLLPQHPFNTPLSFFNQLRSYSAFIKFAKIPGRFDFLARPSRIRRALL